MEMQSPPPESPPTPAPERSAESMIASVLMLMFAVLFAILLVWLFSLEPAQSPFVGWQTEPGTQLVQIREITLGEDQSFGMSGCYAGGSSVTYRGIRQTRIQDLRSGEVQDRSLTMLRPGQIVRITIVDEPYGGACVWTVTQLVVLADRPISQWTGCMNGGCGGG